MVVPVVAAAAAAAATAAAHTGGAQVVVGWLAMHIAGAACRTGADDELAVCISRAQPRATSVAILTLHLCSQRRG